MARSDHRRRANTSIPPTLPPRSAKRVILEVMGGAKRSSEARKHVNPAHITSKISEAGDSGGNGWREAIIGAPHAPRALIGSSGEISELPQERSDEDSAEKFAPEDPRRSEATRTRRRNLLPRIRAGAKRRGPGGEIYSRGPDSAEKSTPEDPITTSAPNHVRPRCR